MSQHQVIIDDLNNRADKLESKAESYGEDLGTPYREAAQRLRQVAKTYAESAPEVESA